MKKLPVLLAFAMTTSVTSGALAQSAPSSGGDGTMTCKQYAKMSANARMKAITKMAAAADASSGAQTDGTASAGADSTEDVTSDGMTNMGNQIASYCKDNPDATVEDAMSSMSD
ncbi:HdeA/HdeB family chaperone [Jiella sp. M17.18]|uniref:HdeA/HdeB family chaperone n=1 Tax=Jiella sp. M17.18 TaxID=3234247 RepID=UPI0034DFCB9D